MTRARVPIGATMSSVFRSLSAEALSPADRRALWVLRVVTALVATVVVVGVVAAFDSGLWWGLLALYLAPIAVLAVVVVVDRVVRELIGSGG